MSLLAEDTVIASTTRSTTKKTTSDATATAESLLALALHACTLCVLVVVLSALLLLAPAAVVLAFPVACMVASLYLLCAITARLLALSHVLPPDRGPEQRGSRKQDLVEVDREAPCGNFDDEDISTAEEEHGEISEHAGGYEFSSAEEDDFGGSFHGEQHRFCFVDTYYKSFYDLLAFWRSIERGQWR